MRSFSSVYSTFGKALELHQAARVSTRLNAQISHEELHRGLPLVSQTYTHYLNLPPPFGVNTLPNRVVPQFQRRRRLLVLAQGWHNLGLGRVRTLNAVSVGKARLIIANAFSVQNRLHAGPRLATNLG